MKRNWSKNPLSVNEIDPDSELAAAFRRVHSRQRLQPIEREELADRWSDIKKRVAGLDR